MLMCLAADHGVSDRKLLYLPIADTVLQLPFWIYTVHAKKSL